MSDDMVDKKDFLPETQLDEMDCGIMEEDICHIVIEAVEGNITTFNFDSSTDEDIPAAELKADQQKSLSTAGTDINTASNNCFETAAKSDEDPAAGGSNPSCDPHLSNTCEDNASVASKGQVAEGPNPGCDLNFSDICKDNVLMDNEDQLKPKGYDDIPSKVDFQHLKEVMLQVIQEQVTDEGDADAVTTTVIFRDVLYELFNSDRLHPDTRMDLTVPMAFLSLLTVASEQGISLDQPCNCAFEDIKITFARNM